MAEPIPLLEDWRFWQIVVTAFLAFLGFTFGTWVKYGFDLRLLARREKQERIAVAVEVQSDLVALRLLAVSGLDVVDQIFGMSSQITARSLGMMALPPQDFLERAPGRLGLLGPDVSIRVLVAHTGANSFRYTFQSLLVYGPDRQIPPGELESLRRSYASLVKVCDHAIDALENVTGRKIPRHRHPTDKAGNAASEIERPEVAPK